MTAPVEAAALVLADHPVIGHPNRATETARCGCWLDNQETGWRGPYCDHPAHLARVLADAGLLKEET